MNKVCFKKGCKKQPAFTCECKKGVYFCKKHMGDHMLLQKTHNLESLFLILDQDEEQKLKKKVLELISVYSEIQKKAQKYFRNLIDSVISQSNKLIDQIASHSEACSRIFNCITRSVPIDNEDLKLIENLIISEDISKEFNCTEIMKSLKLDFQQQSRKIFNKCLQDNFVFNQDQTDLNNLLCLNTNTLKLERKRFDFESSYYIGSSVQYKSNIYYLAMISYPAFNTSSGSSYNFCIKKIDLNLGSTEKIYNSTRINGGPLILHNDSIFMLSSYQNIYRLDIEKGTWNNAGNMPESLTYISASTYIDTIFVTGYSSGYIYSIQRHQLLIILLYLIREHTDIYLINGLFRLMTAFMRCREVQLLSIQLLKT